MYSQIEIQPAWITYIQKNSPIIFGWIRSEMINYLQKRNYANRNIRLIKSETMMKQFVNYLRSVKIFTLMMKE